MNKLDSRGRVVVGVDGSAGSLAALRSAFGEAKRWATGLLVVGSRGLGGDLAETPDLAGAPATIL